MKNPSWYAVLPGSPPPSTEMTLRLIADAVKDATCGRSVHLPELLSALEMHTRIVRREIDWRKSQEGAHE